MPKFKGQEANEIDVGTKLYCIKNCLEKGIEEVKVTRIDKPGIYWADDDGYPYLNMHGCLLRALFLGYDVFLEYEEAAKETTKIYRGEIQKLQKSIDAIAEKIPNLTTKIN